MLPVAVMRPESDGKKAADGQERSPPSYHT